MSRLPRLTSDNRTEDQQRLFERITGGARAKAKRDFDLADADGVLRGPFNALLQTPEIGDAVQRLGALLRFESALPGALRELAILMVARRSRANYEWYAHARIARREGMDETVIAAIETGRAPDAGPEMAVVHRFVSELLERHRVSDASYGETLALLGERGVVELVVLVGYYGLIAATLNAFEVPVPEGETAPFPD